jgi:hypothetical protein
VQSLEPSRDPARNNSPSRSSSALLMPEDDDDDERGRRSLLRTSIGALPARRDVLDATDLTPRSVQRLLPQSHVRISAANRQDVAGDALRKNYGTRSRRENEKNNRTGRNGRGKGRCIGRNEKEKGRHHGQSFEIRSPN